MPYSVLGELLVVFLLVINSSRIFFLKYGRVDTLAALAPLAVLIAVLQLFAWYADFFSVLLLGAAVIALCTNIHALSRSAARLYVDHYSPVFILFSVFVLLLSLLAGVLIVKYPPVSVKASEFGVIETKTRLTGSFAGGFSDVGYTDRTDALLYTYAPADGNSPGPVVLVGCDKRGDAAAYRPYMILLASKGYTVLACDFSTKDGKWFSSAGNWRVVRRFVMLLSYFRDKNQFDRQKDFYTFGMLREYKALVQIVSAKFGESRKLFIVSDGMGNTAAADIKKQSAGRIQGLFRLDSVPEYKTPGFGCLEQTEPILAAYFGLGRDRTLFIPRYLVIKTEAAVKAGK